jgi:hypothetical protein
MSVGRKRRTGLGRGCCHYAKTSVMKRIKNKDGEERWRGSRQCQSSMREQWSTEDVGTENRRRGVAKKRRQGEVAVWQTLSAGDAATSRLNAWKLLNSHSINSHPSQSTSHSAITKKKTRNHTRMSNVHNH